MNMPYTRVKDERKKKTKSCHPHKNWTKNLKVSDAIFTVTRVDPDLDREDATYVARNEIDAWVHYQFDAQKTETPVRPQLLGKKLEDEKVVQVVEEICDVAELPFIYLLR
ncbi:hypothetical protein NHQ30_006155 [Ciborinia camelliae]|nr:hypothetical protein NHQ30_006155 [Ciborinia camelliae]